MTMFIPRDQLNNMLQAQANQVLCNSTDPTARLIALNTLANTQPNNPSNLIEPLQPSSGWDFCDDLF